jgi:vancomycin resistance protein YoaR
MDKKINFFLLILILAAGLADAFLLLGSFRAETATKLSLTERKNSLPQSASLINLPSDLNLVFGKTSETIEKTILITWIDFGAKNNFSSSLDLPLTAFGLWTNSYNSDKLLSLALNEPVLGDYILGLEAKINKKPQNAELLIENSQATHFLPHQEGQALDLARTRNLIASALESRQTNVNLPVKFLLPQVKLGDLNNLGIKELISRGQSDFSGSSASRIKNIATGASRFQGILIKPGEEFSFNKYLGSVDAAHGFLPELVIKPEGTVPELGGGLCQVSSTAFRAAFFAGLPITERRNHSYAVKYYEWISDDQPRASGLDATIYPGAQDFKFQNDTAGIILVWTYISGNRLYFDFYGTPDGRQVIVDGPHPYDRRDDGSVKSEVKRTVILPSGESQELTFNSTYVSPNRYPRIYEFPKNLESSNPTSTPATVPN